MARPTYAEALTFAQQDVTKLLAMLVSGQKPDGTAFGSTPAALGQTTAANSLPVVLASDQGAVPVTMDAAALAALESIQIGSIAAGETHLGEVGGRTVIPAAAQFTRPADTTAYASGDLVANSTTAGSVTPLTFTIARVTAGSGMIRRARIKKSGTSITNAQFRLHLYTSAPTPANGDNGVWSTDQAATYLGAIDVTVDRAFTDGAVGNGVPIVGNEMNFALPSGTTVRGLLEARAAYTPANAETFDVSLEVLQN